MADLRLHCTQRYPTFYNGIFLLFGCYYYLSTRNQPTIILISFLFQDQLTRALFKAVLIFTWVVSLYIT